MASTPAPTELQSRILWPFILASFASLFASAYFDIIRGPLLPKIASNLQLEFTQTSWFLAVGHIAAIVATLIMMRALNRWSERQVMLTITALGVVTAALAPLASSLGSLLLLGVLLGATISTVGGMANVLLIEGAPARVQGRLMSASHSLYGFGSMFAATVVGWAMSEGLNWQTLFAAAAPLYIGLYLYALTKLRRTSATAVAGNAAHTVQSIKLNKAQMLIVLTFSIYVAGEVMTSIWMTSYLVEVRHLTISMATPILTAYFLVFTVTRVACALWLRPTYERLVMRAALSLAVIGFVLGYFSIAGGSPWGLALMGAFGPFFPVFLARVCRVNPDRWRSTTIWIIVAMNVTIGTANVALGRIADIYGIRSAFVLAPALIGTALVLLNLYLHTAEVPEFAGTKLE